MLNLEATQNKTLCEKKCITAQSKTSLQTRWKETRSKNKRRYRLNKVEARLTKNDYLVSSGGIVVDGTGLEPFVGNGWVVLRVDELFGVRGCCVFRVSQGCRIVREPLQSIGSLVLQGQPAENKERDGENRA